MRFPKAETFEVICQEFCEIACHEHCEDHCEHHTDYAEKGPRDFQDLTVSNLLNYYCLLLSLRLFCWIVIEAAWEEKG